MPCASLRCGSALFFLTRISGKSYLWNFQCTWIWNYLRLAGNLEVIPREGRASTVARYRSAIFNRWMTGSVTNSNPINGFASPREVQNISDILYYLLWWINRCWMRRNREMWQHCGKTKRPHGRKSSRPYPPMCGGGARAGTGRETLLLLELSSLHTNMQLRLLPEFRPPFRFRRQKPHRGRVAVISAKIPKRQRRKRQSVTAKKEKSQTLKVLTAILTLPNLT